MKNKIKYIFAGMLLIISGSCTDWLNIKPLDRMVLDDYWKTKNDVESVVLACYRAMEEPDFMERIISAGELRSDNVIVDLNRLKSTQAQVDISDVNISATNDLLPWKSFYMVINYCNTVLKYAPDVVNIDPEYTSGYLHAHEAEARTIRALAYFYLVRIYRDVPYIDFPYSEDTQEFNVPKMSGDEILERQIAELNEAEKSALKVWGNTSQQKGRVTKNTVRALLADIYLWLGRYDDCIDACNRILPDVVGENEVINPDLATGAELRLISNRMNYTNSFQSLFVTQNSMESIFELQFNQTVENSKIYTLYGNSSNIGQFAASPVVQDIFTANDFINDLRGKFSFINTVTTSGTSVQGFSQIFKYIGINYIVMSNAVGYMFRTSTTANINWIIYRLADVYLMKAEALVERNTGSDLSDALALVNLIYMRSNPDQRPLLDTNYPDQDAMRKLVMDERQREFLFEGKRWFDLMRLARKEDKSSAAGKDSHPNMLDYVARKYQFNADVVRSKLRNTDALYLPVAQKELIANGALVQNPYYVGIFDK